MTSDTHNNSGDTAPTPTGWATLPRRRFLGGGAKLAALGALGGWLPAFRVTPASAQTTCAAPPDFPAGIDLYQQAYSNWSGEVAVDPVWTCAPQTPAQVVTIVNWAHAHGYKVRAQGRARNWSPLTLASGPGCPDDILLVDTTQHLTAMAVDTGTTPATVTAQTGVTVDALLAYLETYNLGVTHSPAMGDVTLGGVLATGAHGTALPAAGEVPLAGKTYGTLSNLVLAITAVVWDAANQQYALRTFQRSDPECAALLIHLGRAFVTEVKLQAGANQRLRCQTWVNIPATELYAAPGSSGRTYASYVQSTGRLTAIWFPFTDKPWVKVWSLAPSKPFFSRQVTSPYPETFTQLTPDLADLAAQIIAGNGALTPTFGQFQYTAVASGVVLTFAYDLWGWSKNLLSYVTANTLPVTPNSYAVLTSRANIQQVVHEFTTHYQARIAAYQAQGRYPVNGPLEIRVSGLDTPADVALSGAVSPQLSPARPRPDHPEWDVAIWIDIVTIPGTPYAAQFFREMEQWMYGHYSGSYAMVRAEWCKGWAFTDSAGWSDAAMLGSTIPDTYRTGQAAGDGWDAAHATLDALDPFRVYTAPVLDALAL